MSEQHPADASPSPEAARALIAERDRLRAWIGQLEAHGSEAPTHVLERVRGDYQDRLQRVTAELGEHLDTLRQSLSGLRELQAAADVQLGAARDALAEARLRHLIGELEPEAWEERRPALEAAVDAGERECTEAGDEVARLVELVAEIEGAETAPAEAPVAAEEPVAQVHDDAEELEPYVAMEAIEAVDLAGAAEMTEAAATSGEQAAEGESAGEEVDSAVDELFAVWDEPAAEGAQGEEEEALPWLAIEEPAAEEGEEGMELEFLREVSEPEESAPSAAPADDGLSDLAFLEELDRVIASTAPSAANGGDAAPQGAPAAGLICKECGASNDARSWYCEICGMELT